MNHRNAPNRSGAYGSAGVPMSSGRTTGRRTRKRDGVDIPLLKGRSGWFVKAKQGRNAVIGPPNVAKPALPRSDASE
jgi:hypothetical protein